MATMTKGKNATRHLRDLTTEDVSVLRSALSMASAHWFRETLANSADPLSHRACNSLHETAERLYQLVSAASR